MITVTVTVWWKGGRRHRCDTASLANAQCSRPAGLVQSQVCPERAEPDWLLKTCGLSRSRPVFDPRSFFSLLLRFVRMPSIWGSACESATSRPLQTLLDTIYASCGLTVSQGCTCIAFRSRDPQAHVFRLLRFASALLSVGRCLCGGCG